MQVTQQLLRLADYQGQFSHAATGPAFIALGLEPHEEQFASDINRIRHVISLLLAR